MLLLPGIVNLLLASLACMCLTESIVHSARLKGQFARILPPYIDLGFDQQVIAIAKNEAEVTIRMQDMETIKFHSQYGRPMYTDLAWNYSCSFHYQVECMPCTAGSKRK